MSSAHPVLRGSLAVIDRRIKPFLQQQAEQVRRTLQTQIYRRNQTLGLVLIAAIILLSWLLRANPKWIFPTGWWRL